MTKPMVGKKAFAGLTSIDLTISTDEVMDRLGLSELPWPDATNAVCIKNASKDFQLFLKHSNWKGLSATCLVQTNNDPTIRTYVEYKHRIVAIKDGRWKIKKLFLYHGPTIEGLFDLLQIDKKYIHRGFEVVKFSVASLSGFNVEHETIEIIDGASV